MTDSDSFTISSGDYFTHESGDTYKAFAVSDSGYAPLCEAVEAE